MNSPFFDIDFWKNRFPLESLRCQARVFVLQRQQLFPTEYADEGQLERHVALMSPGGQVVVGPRDMAIVEQLRNEGLAGRACSETVATSVFVFGLSEPEDRRQTKIGGLPFRSLKRPWPVNPEGQPLSFLGQFCFADALNTGFSLPGDILLVFGELDDLMDATKLRFEWVSFSLSEDLIQASPAPEIDAVYGLLHRTWDAEFDEDEYSMLEPYNGAWLLEKIQGTKIGGLPGWIQDDETPKSSRFLCALGSTGQAPGQAWPWVNVEEAIPEGADQNCLMWGDGGSLYLFWNGERIIPVVQC
jgi:hypothetical protein